MEVSVKQKINDLQSSLSHFVWKTIFTFGCTDEKLCGMAISLCVVKKWQL